MGEVRNQLRHANEHGGGVAALHHLAIHQAFDVERLRILDLIACDNRRAKRAGLIKALAQHPLFLVIARLNIAGAQIVGAGVTAHIFERIGLAHAVGLFANYNRQLGLPIHAGGGIGMPGDRVAGVRDGVGHFGKHHRLGGQRGARHFLGVRGVIHADRHDLAGDERRAQFEFGYAAHGLCALFAHERCGRFARGRAGDKRQYIACL